MGLDRQTTISRTWGNRAAAGMNPLRTNLGWPLKPTIFLKINTYNPWEDQTLVHVFAICTTRSNGSHMQYGQLNCQTTTISQKTPKECQQVQLGL